MTTYVAFDGDQDIWAYQYMRGWSTNRRIDFELLDAHDLDNMTARAQGEYYVKGKLRDRMERADAFVLLVGESTRYLRKYVGWEIDLALELGLPLIVVNLNNKVGIDGERCPARLRRACAVHIPFKLAAIRYALNLWPGEFRTLPQAERATGARSYGEGLTAQWLVESE
jgi:hypothetical protein